MEHYPVELSHGVTPLIFVVDAILSPLDPHKSSSTASSASNTNQNATNPNPNDAPLSLSSSPNNKPTKAFDLFLESISNSNNDDDEDGRGTKSTKRSSSSNDNDPLSSVLAIDAQTMKDSSYSSPTKAPSSTTASTSLGKRMSSVLTRSSSKGTSHSHTNSNSNSRNKENDDERKSILDFFQNARMIPVSPRHAFPPSKDPEGNYNHMAKVTAQVSRRTSMPMVGTSHSNHYPHSDYNPYSTSTSSSSPASAAAYSHGTAASHGTTTTSSGAIHTIHHHHHHYNSPIQEVLSKDPIQGILASGWMEKHVHALPSVLLLVTKVDLDSNLYEQARLEKHLSRTCEILRSSLAKKRECRIHLVCLMEHSSEAGVGVGVGAGSGSGVAGVGAAAGVGAGTSNPLGRVAEGERLSSIRTVCRLSQPQVSILRLPPSTDAKNRKDGEDEHDESGDAQPTIEWNAYEMFKLQKTIQESSMAYYMVQARRCKKKLSMLNTSKYVEYLPVAARYCIKIAVFYEFQCPPNDFYNHINNTNNSNSNNSSNASGKNFSSLGVVVGDAENSITSKSFKYWNEAYGHLMNYYQYLRDSYFAIHGRDSGSASAHNASSSPDRKQSQSKVSIPNQDETNDETTTTIASTNSAHGPSPPNSPIAAPSENANTGTMATDESDDTTTRNSSSPPKTPMGDGVEVALAYSPHGSSDGITIGAKSPDSSLPLSHNPHDGSSSSSSNGDNAHPDDAEGDEGDSGTDTHTDANAKTSDTTTTKPIPTAMTITHSRDMVHQCRGVADWLNFKLLMCLGGGANALAITPLSSSTEVTLEEGSGMLAVSTQIQRHSQVFLNQPWALREEKWDEDGAYGEVAVEGMMEQKEPAWHYWLYVSQQRLVLSELMERYYPPSNLVPSSTLTQEVLLHCCASRHYASLGESYLKLALGVQKEKDRMDRSEKNGGPTGEDFFQMSVVDSGENRQRYVGGLGSGDLYTKFQSESTCDHSGLALKCLSRALELRSEEVKALSGETKSSDTNITCARLHYLIGGILMKGGNYRKAAGNLRKALDLSDKWPSLRLVLEKALVKCWEKCPAELSEDEISGDEMNRRKAAEMSLSLVLNSKINSLMSSAECEAAAKLAFTNNISKQLDCLQWPYMSHDSVPFYFSFTFPNSTSATAGDVVPAMLTLHSNLKVPVKIEGIKIDTNIGTFDVPPNQIGQLGKTTKLLNGNSILPGQSVRILTTVSLPNHTSEFFTSASDKYSVKSVKPKTSGLSQLGGGLNVTRTLSDSSPSETIVGTAKKKANLGGLSVCCLAIELAIQRIDNNSNTVYLKVHNVHRGSIKVPESVDLGDSSIKYAPLEQDNFIYSAWDRPTHFPIAFGPRCLRVLPPQSHLEVVNLTELETNGRVMEGTVNRVLLKIKAGLSEDCHEVKMNVTCTSGLAKPDGKPLVMSTENSSSEENQIDSKTIVPRPPMLVKAISMQEYDGASECQLNSDLPKGWITSGGESGQGVGDDWYPVASILENGKEAFASFDLFRSLPLYPSNGSNSALEEVDPEGSGDIVCRTDFVVQISYKQSRPERADDVLVGDFVTQEYHGFVLWSTPIRAQTFILPGVMRSFPSGNRHPSNLVSQNNNVAFKPNTVTDGEKLAIRCNFEAKEAKNSLAVKIEKVLFEHKIKNDDSHRKHLCDVQLVNEGSDQANNVLFVPKPIDFCHILRHGSKFNIVFTVQPKIKNTGGDCDPVQHATERLGVIVVHWTPISLPVPEGVSSNLSDKHDAFHGPLPIPMTSPIQFYGPSCYIEAAPFEARMQSIPATPRVATPFQVGYTIRNKTHLHQELKVAMDEANDISSGGLLVSGLINGDIRIGPMETKQLNYSLLAARAGKTSLPALNVSSTRYNSWVIDGGRKESFFVMPS